jgi:hypothetical protein
MVSLGKPFHWKDGMAVVAIMALFCCLLFGGCAQIDGLLGKNVGENGISPALDAELNALSSFEWAKPFAAAASEQGQDPLPYTPRPLPNLDSSYDYENRKMNSIFRTASISHEVEQVRSDDCECKTCNCIEQFGVCNCEHESESPFKTVAFGDGGGLFSRFRRNQQSYCDSAGNCFDANGVPLQKQVVQQQTQAAPPDDTPQEQVSEGSSGKQVVVGPDLADNKSKPVAKEPQRQQYTVVRGVNRTYFRAQLFRGRFFSGRLRGLFSLFSCRGC